MEAKGDGGFAPFTLRETDSSGAQPLAGSSIRGSRIDISVFRPRRDRWSGQWTSAPDGPLGFKVLKFRGGGPLNEKVSKYPVFFLESCSGGVGTAPPLSSFPGGLVSNAWLRLVFDT